MMKKLVTVLALLVLGSPAAAQESDGWRPELVRSWCLWSSHHAAMCVAKLRSPLPERSECKATVRYYAEDDDVEAEALFSVTEPMSVTGKKRRQLRAVYVPPDEWFDLDWEFYEVDVVCSTPEGDK